MINIIKRQPKENYEKLKELVVTIENPKEHFPVSKSRRAKYFKINDPLPKKYQNKNFIFKKYNSGELRLYNVDNQEFVIKNNKVAGKPKLWKVNGQELYNGSLFHSTRAKIAKEVHLYLREYIKDLPNMTANLEKGSYLSIKMVIYSPLPDNVFWDCSNKWIWIKWFEDVLSDAKKIKDDNILYIRSSGTIEYIESETPKFEFIISLIKLK